MSADLELVSVTAWQAGYAYAVDLIADVLDDVKHAMFPVPKYTREQRIQRRIAEMETAAEMVSRQIAAELAGAPRRPWGCSP